jgi:hypothetical protein
LSKIGQNMAAPFRKNRCAFHLRVRKSPGSGV